MAKIIFEDDSSAKIEILNESNELGQEGKRYHIRGIFSTIGERNRNGRTYPYELWAKEVEAYQQEIAKGSINTLMEYQHPARTTVDMMKAVGKIIELKIIDNGRHVYGDSVLLDNPEANQLKSLIDNGIKISVSSRGVGSVDEHGKVKNFKLITYDIVSSPSDFNATMNGVCESHPLNEGVLQGKDFDISNGSIVEITSPMLSETDFRERLKSEFTNFIRRL